MRSSVKLDKLDERGFTILEVLVAGAIGIVVAFTVARTAINAANAQRSSQLDLANVAMMSRLQNAIDDPVLCPSVWFTWNTGTSTFDPATFDPTGGTPTITIDRLVDGAPSDIARTAGAAGGPTSGLTVPSMTFTEPFQVSDNTYDWTLMMKTTKKLSDGTELGTTIRRIRLEITTDGSPTYKATSCGPPVSPAANQQVPMLRFTMTYNGTGTVPGDSVDATLDTACSTEFTSLYSAASLQDLIPYKMILYHNFSGGDGGFANQFNFTVADLQPKVIFSNSIDPAVPTRPPGTIVSVKNGVAGDTPHVACIRNTAPMRFVRGFYNVSDVVNGSTKAALCKSNIGFAYDAASVNDLIRFGFRLADGTAGTHMDPGAPGAVFDGPGGIGVACRIGWVDNGVVGPGIDCTVAGNYPIACVLR